MKGTPYGLPWNGGQLMLYYNRKLFRQAGLPDPPPRDWSWTEWLEACQRLTRDQDYALQLGLRMFQTVNGGFTHYLMAASMLVLLPILIIFFFAQRQLVRGITLTGIKG